jgi:hypothetical protein
MKLSGLMFWCQRCPPGSLVDADYHHAATELRLCPQHYEEAAMTVQFTPLGKKTPKQIENRWAIVLDASGSMAPIRRSVVDAYNTIVDSIKAAGLKENQKNLVTLAIFGRAETRNGYETEFPRVLEPAETISKLTYDDYIPTGGTPLFDAVADAIDKFSEAKTPETEDTSFVVQVITDGEENSSTRWWTGIAPAGSSVYGHPYERRQNLRVKMDRLQSNGRWTFAFLVPKGKGRAFAETFGIPAGNVSEWEATTEGTSRMSRVSAAATMSYATARSSGQLSSATYFSPDLSKVKSSQVHKLDDLSDRIKIHEVKQESRIDDFVKAKNKGLYAIGSGYYQLSKKEKVQNHKKVLIREKGGKRAIYGGPEARKLLGLPDYELTITPGNHANYDVFVQSKSPNRILPRGSLCAIDHSQKVGEQPTWGT